MVSENLKNIKGLRYEYFICLPNLLAQKGSKWLFKSYCLGREDFLGKPHWSGEQKLNSFKRLLVFAFFSGTLDKSLKFGKEGQKRTDKRQEWRVLQSLILSWISDLTLELWSLWFKRFIILKAFRNSWLSISLGPNKGTWHAQSKSSRSAKRLRVEACLSRG